MAFTRLARVFIALFQASSEYSSSIFEGVLYFFMHLQKMFCSIVSNIIVARDKDDCERLMIIGKAKVDKQIWCQYYSKEERKSNKNKHFIWAILSQYINLWKVEYDLSKAKFCRCQQPGWKEINYLAISMAR